MLQLVQRGPLTRTTCAVDATAGAGSTERLESFLDPCSNGRRALPVPSVLQLVQAQADVTQSATPQEVR